MTSFRDALERGDIDYLRRFWAEKSPHLPQPETKEAAEIVMHRARTEAESISFKARAYSHRWLIERSLPSGLPDKLKPQAERIYPVAVKAVGISVNFKSEWMRPAMTEVRGSMEAAVEEAFADGRKDTVFVSTRMAEAKAKAMKTLFG